jgi:hypothetical protein
MKVAISQKNVIWLVLVSLISVPALMFWPLAIILCLVQSYFFYKLAGALRSSIPWAYIFLAFVPLVSLIVLLNMNAKATFLLRQNGVRVGLMGAKMADLAGLPNGLPQQNAVASAPVVSAAPPIASETRQPQSAAALVQPLPSQTTSGGAIAAFILSLLPLGVTQILAIVLGIISIRSINRSQGRLKGNGLAIPAVVIASILLIILGVALTCSLLTTPSRTTVISQAGRPALPPEYGIVARNLGQSLESSPDAFRNNKGMAEIIAEGHSAVMALSNVKSSDQNINYVAEFGGQAVSDAVLHLERLDALPKPPSAGSLMFNSFLDGLFGNLRGGYDRGVDAQSKQDAIFAELQALAATCERVDAASLLLQKVAEKYGAPMTSAEDRINIYFSESWYGTGPYDWCGFYNSGGELDDCTLIVELTGAEGEQRKNVHYLGKWPSKSWVYARYEGGTQLENRSIGRTTVYNVDKVDATVLSPRFSGRVNYVYTGAEKDKRVAEYCKDMKLSWRYQPFDKGIIWDDQRGVILTLKDYPYLGKVRVDVTFRCGSASKGWYWEYDSWQQGEEKKCETPAGGLDYDPDIIDVVLSFPRTNYHPRWELKR